MSQCLPDNENQDLHSSGILNSKSIRTSNTKLNIKTKNFSRWSQYSIENKNNHKRKYSNDAEKEDAEVEVKMMKKKQQQQPKKIPSCIADAKKK